MTDDINVYLKQVASKLSYLNEEERQKILEEIESHLYEKIETGSSIQTALAGFGTPEELARSYGSIRLSKTKKFTLGHVLKVLKFSLLTGFKGMVVIPCASLLTLVFYATSVMLLFGGLIKGVGTALGVDVPFVMLSFDQWQAPIWLGVLASLVMAVVLQVASRKLWQFLKRFLKRFSLSYRTEI